MFSKPSSSQSYIERGRIRFLGSTLFVDETGGVWPSTRILLRLLVSKICTTSLMRQKSQEENEKNYTNASSHKSIRGWYFDFALSITRANSFLNTNLHICTEWGMLLKMASFLIVHIDQHIVIIISMKKGRWSWFLKLSKMKQAFVQAALLAIIFMLN